MVVRRTRRRQRGGANCNVYINGIYLDVARLTKQINGIKSEKPTEQKVLKTKFIDFFWENIFNPFKKQIIDDPTCEVSQKELTKLDQSLDSLILSIDAKKGYLTNFFPESYKTEIPESIQAIKSHFLVLKNKSKNNNSKAVTLKSDSRTNTHSPPSKTNTPSKTNSLTKANTPSKTEALVTKIDSLITTIENNSGVSNLADEIIRYVSELDEITKMDKLSYDDYVLFDEKINILKKIIQKNPSQLGITSVNYSETVPKLNIIQKFLFDKIKTNTKEKINPYKKETPHAMESPKSKTEDDKLIATIITRFTTAYKLHLGLLQDKPLLESLVSKKFHGIQLFNESKLSDFEKYKELSYYVFCVVGLFNNFLKTANPGIKFVIKGGKALQLIQPDIQYVSDDIDILVLYEPPITENYVIALINGFSTLFKNIPYLSILKINHDKLLKISYRSRDKHIKVISDIGWKQPDQENIFFNDIKETTLKYTYDMDEDTTYNFYFVYYHQSVDSFFKEKRFYYDKYLEMQQGDCNCDPKETKPQPPNCTHVCSTRDHFLKKFQKYLSIPPILEVNSEYFLTDTATV
jgi:hypothetical protein